ncbi:MAG TPA: transcription termination/antitermination NusG family protein [Pyrinomonadaceae bacterium]|nr:transcription termination/antitermination NusG family protein [Pyrinomonadaceae bacterium]
MSRASGDSLCWYVVHTRPKQEDRTSTNLITWEIETLNPKLRVNRFNEFTGRLTHIVKPLFPGYIFSRFIYNKVFYRVRYTRGVHSLVSFDNQPIPVADEIIEVVRSQMGGDGFVKTVDELKPGDQVIINNGRFQNFYGVFERGMPDSDRVRILLNTVSFQAHVVVDRAVVKKVSGQRVPAQPRFAYSS